MTTTPTDCVFQLRTALQTYWTANALAAAGLSGEVPTIYFEGDEKDGPPDGKVYWARFRNEDVLDRPSTLRDGTTRRYRADGLLFVQIFAPRAQQHPQAYEKGGRLAEVAQKAFRGQSLPGGIIIRDITIRAVPPRENSWWQWNVTGRYEYETCG